MQRACVCQGFVHGNIALSVSDIANIEGSIRAATDKCMVCGADDHFVSNCPLARAVRPHKTSSVERCTRCGRNTHVVSHCFATTNLKGLYI
jgi:hypothetical protein